LLIRQLPEAPKEFASVLPGSRRITNSGSGSRVVLHSRNHCAAVLIQINFSSNIFKVFVLAALALEQMRSVCLRAV
jgi:hypothetical protein